jgi:hypothetical protein
MEQVASQQRLPREANMKRRNITQAEAKRFLQLYRNGQLPQELIRELEKQSGQSIEKLVERIESVFARKSHHIDGMTLPELRRWHKRKDILSDEEKLSYANANGCTYEEYEHLALAELERREKSNDDRKRQELIRSMQKSNAHMDQLVKEGKATTDGLCYVTSLDHVWGC